VLGKLIFFADVTLRPQLSDLILNAAVPAKSFRTCPFAGNVVTGAVARFSAQRCRVFFAAFGSRAA